MLEPIPRKSIGTAYTPDATNERARVRMERLVSAARVKRSVELLRHEIRDVAMAYADDARGTKLRAEQCIISLKRAWTTSADSAGVERPFVSEIAARLVTACVEEFYRDT